ncbi:Protein neprosin [Cardamine amara subsp. amara]|uniref:Protein neprosin n=1 Tax=Cardamine amara subsp. amara TaxID=228776 RepID=A0ABD0Z9L7_CARAN
MRLNQTVFFFLFWVTIAVVVGTLAGKSKPSDLYEQKIEQRLKQLNKPAVKSIHSPDGDIINCVRIYDQPAFAHPLLKNHIIQMRPKSYSIRDKTGGNKADIIYQLWRTKGECPENTIPIRKITRDDLLRSDSIETYGRKSPPSPTISPTINNLQHDQREVHEHACVYVDYGEFHGSKSRISIWKPEVLMTSEFSLAQTWVVNGDWDTGLNSLESGWQILKSLYGDNNPRLFAYWTSDSYQKMGCYNLDCPGFVQVSRDIALGAVLISISTYNGDQYDFQLTIEKEQETGLWWLKFETHLIGYWPSIIVPKLANSARKIAWGGEIVHYPIGQGTHTLTQMGSGHFAEEGFKKAAYFNNIQYIDTSNHPITPFPQNLEAIVSRPECYNLQVGFSRRWGTYIFYGGPGRNPQCL